MAKFNRSLKYFIIPHSNMDLKNGHPKNNWKSFHAFIIYQILNIFRLYIFIQHNNYGQP